jgi:hypothetical protein
MSQYKFLPQCKISQGGSGFLLYNMLILKGLQRNQCKYSVNHVRFYLSHVRLLTALYERCKYSVNHVRFYL